MKLRIGAAVVALSCASLLAQAPAPKLATSTGIPGLIASGLVFNAADVNKDGVVTRDELEAAVAKWLASADTANAGSVTRDQLAPALTAALPMQSLAAMMAPGRGGQPQAPEPNTAQAMMAALPASAPAKPAHPRKVLVLARAAGFVHSSIPLAAATIEALGTKTGAWTTTITYDAAAITSDDLKPYDAIFLASTTGAFLDDPKDETATAARRQALLDFVRGGKGIAGIHAASDSYHRNAPAAPADGRAGGRGAGGGNPFANLAPGATLADVMIAQGDTNKDGKLDKAEARALAGAWFDALDTKKGCRLLSSDFALFAALIPNPPGASVPQEPDAEVGTWPDFNRLIGGYFKFHWLDPQLITVKIDDPKSPLTAMFHGNEFDVRDEIYTMGIKSFSRDNVHVLTSIDYGKMSAADKALESNPRPDHDFGLSWIRHEGQGRVFYEALGHSERIYANKAILEHLLAGMQYVLGDLKADDAPSHAR
jgi:type 1 glutamine amidotransferase